VADTINEEIDARARAERLGLEFVDLQDVEIDLSLFETIPVELMFRYPLCADPALRGAAHRGRGRSDRRADDRRAGAAAGTPIEVSVGTRAAIQEILKRSESSQRVLDEADRTSCGSRSCARTRRAKEVLSIERINVRPEPDRQSWSTPRSSTRCKRRASDIHIESRDREVRDQVPDRRPCSTTRWIRSTSGSTRR